MNSLLIAWKNAKQRGLASLLTTISLALSVGLVVLVLSIHGIVGNSFERNKTVGYNLVIGAKGSPLQLTLNTVYYLSQPVENLPYSYFLEFFPQAERQRQFELCGGQFRGADSDGKFSLFSSGALLVPVCLGDYHGEYRVVGTTPDFFNELKHGPNVDQAYEFAEGRNFEEYNDENLYFEAVVGSRVAATMGIKIGDRFSPTHGAPASEDGKPHATDFKIVGILKPTGTPNDRATFVNMEGFFLMEGHAKLPEELPEGGEEAASAGGRAMKPLPLNQREVTAILLRHPMPLLAMRMQNVINEDVQAQAATPIKEISTLMGQFVNPILAVLLLITAITCIVASVGILVSIYNSMNDRRRDIAVMRALGARRGTVMWVILLESGLIAACGGLLGWVAAHASLGFLGPRIEAQTGVPVTFFSTTSAEIYVVPMVLALAAIAGFIPALVAYRTDVGESLSA